MPQATRSQPLAASPGSTSSTSRKDGAGSRGDRVGQLHPDRVRPIEVNDLLRRDPVEPLTELIVAAAGGIRSW